MVSSNNLCALLLKLFAPSLFETLFAKDLSPVQCQMDLSHINNPNRLLTPHPFTGDVKYCLSSSSWVLFKITLPFPTVYKEGTNFHKVSNVQSSLFSSEEKIFIAHFTLAENLFLFSQSRYQREGIDNHTCNVLEQISNLLLSVKVNTDLSSN